MPRREFVTWTGQDDGKEMKPSLRFRVFAEGNRSRVFVEVYVWAYLWQLRALRRCKKGEKTLAFFQTTDEIRTEPDKRGRRPASKKIGEIHLCLKTSTYNTVSHEAYHATRHFARRMKQYEAVTVKEADKERIHRDMPEEINARFHGYLTDRIISELLEHLKKPARR